MLSSLHFASGKVKVKLADVGVVSLSDMVLTMMDGSLGRQRCSKQECLSVKCSYLTRTCYYLEQIEGHIRRFVLRFQR